ncbi:MAG: hypothetical protein ACYDH8_03340 [Syntrophales bacterium]
MISVYVATEDQLSEALVERLVQEENQGMHIAVRMRKEGNGYLRKNMLSFNKIACSFPVLLFTDLDRCDCPMSIIKDWCGEIVLRDTLLLRIAVRETEAWLLADREGFAEFSGVPVHRIPLQPELLDNPKEVLINLIRRYGKKRVVKADILPEKNSTAKVGLAYNQALCGFVQGSWSLERAAQSADSLNRARCRLHDLNLKLKSRPCP